MTARLETSTPTPILSRLQWFKRHNESGKGYHPVTDKVSKEEFNSCDVGRAFFVSAPKIGVVVVAKKEESWSGKFGQVSTYSMTFEFFEGDTMEEAS